MLSFNRAPETIDDHGAYTYLEDGGVLIVDGQIVEVAAFSDLSGKGEVIDHRPNLIMPGFIDPHLHFPQLQIVGAYAAELLDWLNDHTFPEEMRFADAAHANKMAGHFFDELLANGTTTCVAFCSSSPASANAFFGEAAKRGMRVLGGKTCMDRNAPAGLCDTAQSSYDDSKALISKWHGQGRLSYAITPRFAITSTPDQMAAMQTLAREHPDLHIQTHLSENHAEIAFTKELYNEARDYLDIYEKYDLLTDKTLLGHAIHLEPREIDRMAETGAIAVHCPTSNLFLGSGLFDLFGLEKAGVRTGLATDIGGGTSWSMLRTMDEAYKIQQLRSERLNPLKSFYWATKGNAEALGMSDKIGTLDEGTEADIIVLDARATKAMDMRMERVEDLAQELFVLQTMGDDRSVKATYVAGKDSSVIA